MQSHANHISLSASGCFCLGPRPTCMNLASHCGQACGSADDLLPWVCSAPEHAGPRRQQSLWWLPALCERHGLRQRTILRLSSITTDVCVHKHDFCVHKRGRPARAVHSSRGPCAKRRQLSGDGTSCAGFGAKRQLQAVRSQCGLGWAALVTSRQEAEGDGRSSDSRHPSSDRGWTALAPSHRRKTTTWTQGLHKHVAAYRTRRWRVVYLLAGRTAQAVLGTPGGGASIML